MRTSQPASTNINTAIAPPVRVAIQDGFGTTVTTSTLPVTIAIGTNPSSGTLSGTLTVNAVAGVATFSNLSINKAGVGYTLVASSPNVASATSNTFDVVIPVVFDSGTILSSQLTNPANSVIYRPAFGDVLVSDFGAYPYSAERAAYSVTVEPRGIRGSEAISHRASA